MIFYLGVIDNLNLLKEKNIKIAIGSSSKNTQYILREIGLENLVYAICDGNKIIKSKPDLEGYLKAGKMLGIEPQNCLVAEDADSGIIAGKNAQIITLTVNGAKVADFTFLNLKNNFIFDIIKA